MRLGLTPFRGSNPRSSAGRQAGDRALCPAGEVPSEHLRALLARMLAHV
jgi:hypothetical protein